ncbi:hypothetical protein BAUCODRAFT_499058 [Baudoinia panamericana UAMH 10762]|uniref:Uncharacterized protein n=1 Tax=Baudoinia panamericana (strain UAMH 10762) TaxID=717646 RepID=M2MGD5_BAUPA|nr:uncharacterized protein BAUCODRAFT_499058 [Baudoinia panamericana UAMH 10762]EMC95691.1 hypothetical protein BAUCODRAFT_499058 [Baudoinia panamericana UAMH 10762]
MSQKFVRSLDTQGKEVSQSLMPHQQNPPEGPPPNYPQQAHYDAGPAGADPRGFGNFGSPPPQQQYGPGPGPYQQGGPGPYGPPQQGYYQQQPMYYQQAPPQQGGYYGNRPSGGAGEGICAGILGALACCCCLDFLF